MLPNVRFLKKMALQKMLALYVAARKRKISAKRAQIRAVKANECKIEKRTAFIHGRNGAQQHRDEHVFRKRAQKFARGGKQLARAERMCSTNLCYFGGSRIMNLEVNRGRFELICCTYHP